MIRGNLIRVYKRYCKNLQSLQIKTTKCRNLEDTISTTKNNVTNKITIFTSIANKKLQEYKTDRWQPTISTCKNSSNDLVKQLKNIKIYNIKLHNKNLFSKLSSGVISRNNVIFGSTLGVSTVTTNEGVTIKPIETTTPIIESIPEPPAIPDVDLLVESANQLNALGEPTFASLGLSSWSPIGIVLRSLEFLHVSLDLPWWGAIVIGTVIVRTLMFPLVIIAQRNAARMNNYLPQLQTIQMKMTEARQIGNRIESARYNQEMMLFMKEKDLNPLKNMIVPLAQMPLFISFFMGLRKMANLPVESLREGGMLWFTDLTVPDQYFALPIITSLTLWATVELGTDSAKLSSQNLHLMKYVLRALPIIIFPFTMNFPGAILCYWVASNFISLGQVGLLRIPTVRDYFKIEKLIKHNPQNLPIQSKGFVGGLKDSWTNVKLTKELEARKRYDELQFQRAGRGPVVKTYKYDPTKQVNSSSATVHAKKY